MQFLYIDESGTNTIEHADKFPYFIISLVHVFDKDKLKKVIKKYISKNYAELQKIDDGKMFKNGKFCELKGSSLTPIIKKDFASYLAKSNLFEVYYIIVENKLITQKMYQNKARAFNYCIDLCMTANLRNKNLPYDDYNIQIDERNIRTDANKVLQEYLATELGLKNEYIGDVTVQYFDSSINSLIQLSDYFANLMYSYKMKPKNYKTTIQELLEKNIIKDIFIFPKNKKKKNS